MLISIFLDENYSSKVLSSLDLPLSEFAVGAMNQTANPSRYMFNRERMYADVGNLHLFEKCKNIGAADAILLPTDYSHAKRRAPELLQHFLSLSERFSKPLIISSLGDTTEDIPGQRTIVLRTSKYRWSANKNEIFCPPIVNDRSKQGKISLIYNKPKRPTVGFVGFAIKPKSNNFIGQKLPFGYRDHLFNILTPLSKRLGPKRSGFYYRKSALDILNADKRVDLDFIQRSHWGLLTSLPDEQLKNHREEYDNNIEMNMFTLCVRGAGNFSLRLFEVLSMGRIPILIDTEDVRPCEEELDYSDFCFITSWKDLASLNENFMDFYTSASVETLTTMQTKARHAFEHHLDFRVFSKILFYSKLPNLLKNI